MNIDWSTMKHFKFYIETLGCSKNQVDSEVMISSVQKLGHVFTKESAEADFIIVNTCGFIQSAKEQSINTFLELRQTYPDKKIIIAGCFAQRYFDTLKELFPDADGFYGSQAPSEISSIIESTIKGEVPGILANNLESLPRTDILNFKGSVYVKVAEGCNNNCNYCAIPIIRGQIKSRTLDDVYKEIESLLERGFFEINLIAQDLAAWGEDLKTKNLIPLLKKISNLPGKFWIRLLYIHPDKFPIELLDLCKKDPRILPYFDIPFQHASQRVLKLMGRKGNYNKHLDLVQKIRKELPDSIIRSTIMLGHPGEGHREFREVRDFLIEASLDWVGFFVYSREEDTKSYKMRNGFLTKISNFFANKRKTELEIIQSSITPTRLSALIGQELDVLIEEEVKEEDVFLGRCYIDAPDVDGLVVVRGENLKEGDVVKVLIQSVSNVDLIGVSRK